MIRRLKDQGVCQWEYNIYASVVGAQEIDSGKEKEEERKQKYGRNDGKFSGKDE